MTKIRKTSEINGQIFYNIDYRNGGKYRSTHLSRSYYNRLKNYYCKEKGFKMCDEWLNFQNFADFWEKNVREGYTVLLDKRKKLIDKNSIMILKKE